MGQHPEKLPRETTGEARHMSGIPADEASSAKYSKSKKVARNSVPIVLEISWEMTSRKDSSKRQSQMALLKGLCL